MSEGRKRIGILLLAAACILAAAGGISRKTKTIETFPASGRETAEILLRGRNIPIRYDDRLREMSFGDYEGTENSFSIPDCPVNVIFQHPEAYTRSVGGAETFEELFARTGAFLEEKADPLVKEGKDVLIVGHGAMNSSIVCRVRNLPRSQFWSAGIENCRLMRLI